MLFYLSAYPGASLGSAGTLQTWLQHSALLHSPLWVRPAVSYAAAQGVLCRLMISAAACCMLGLPWER